MPISLQQAISRLIQVLFLLALSACFTPSEQSEKDDGSVVYVEVEDPIPLANDAATLTKPRQRQQRKATKKPKNQMSEGDICENGDCSSNNSSSVKAIDEVRQTINASKHPLAQSAKKYLVSLYQSCDVLEKRQERGKYSTSMSHPPPACKKPVNFPAYSRTNGKPWLRNGIVDTYRYRSGNPKNRLDCSGFVSGALMNAGLKVFPSTEKEISEKTNPELGTAGFRNLGKSKDCFETPKFEDSDSLHAGDIINWRIGRSQHVIIITNASDDPFGVKNLSPEQCSTSYMYDNIANFNFEIAHSMGRPNTGPIKHDIQVFFNGTSSTIKSRFMMLAVNACRAYHKKQTSSSTLSNGNFKVLRHVGDKNPQCIVRNPPRFLGEDCYNQCSKE